MQTLCSPSLIFLFRNIGKGVYKSVNEVQFCNCHGSSFTLNYIVLTRNAKPFLLSTCLNVLFNNIGKGVCSNNTFV
jgi:hypothetical protein